jgi:gluconolactonase
MVDLNTDAGVELVHGHWRYHDAEVTTVDFRSVGEDLGPSGPPNRTYDIIPHAEVPDFDDSGWEILPATELDSRRGTGKVCFNWYRIEVTIPEMVGKFDPTGSTVVFEVIVDDYAEVWVNGKMPRVVGQAGGTVVSGFNSPNRIILGREVSPGQRFQIAVFGINAPLSVSPDNYIWLRTATLDFYAAHRAQPAWDVPFEIDRRDSALDAVIPPDARLEQLTGGFGSTEGPVWVRDGYLLFSSPNTNTIYRWAPDGTVNVFRAKSGYNGFDIGEFPQPGSSGLTFDRSDRLTICQHGHRRIIRVESRSKITVLADCYQGQRLNSPYDLVYRSDGSLYFTDPPFGLPQNFDDPRRELPYSGVFRSLEGQITLLTRELAAPSGIAFSPDEQFLYIGNWEPQKKVVMRYPMNEDGTVAPGEVFYDMTWATGENAVAGLKVDQAGNLYVCGPGGVWILSSEGQVLGMIKGPEIQHNLAWGDQDGRTLFMTAMTGVYRMRLKIPGVRP